MKSMCSKCESLEKKAEMKAKTLKKTAKGEVTKLKKTAAGAAKDMKSKAKDAAKKVPKAKKKVKVVMEEFKKGELHSGSKKGPKVTNPKQAIAIALSEQRKASKKKK
jgi:ABC-type Fe3+-hydroxamate transport system substrate-binding protein